MHRFTFSPDEWGVPDNELSVYRVMRQTRFGVKKVARDVFSVQDVYPTKKLIDAQAFLHLPAELRITLSARARVKQARGVEELLRVMGADYLVSCGFVRTHQNQFLFVPYSCNELYESLWCHHYAPYRHNIRELSELQY